MDFRTEGTASVYIGESNRSVGERGAEHWSDYRSKSSKSHIMKHQQIEHCGEEPIFHLKAVRYFRSALSRQIAEAVRIRRRGGRAEF